MGRRIDPKTGDTYHTKYNPPEDPEVKRRLEQRDDDTEETVRECLRVFRETTEPVIEYYEERGQLERIDGKQSPDEVWADVRKSVKKEK